MAKLKQLLELTVDTDQFDLTDYIERAVGDGWGAERENGVWYVAQDIADDWNMTGCHVEVVV